MKSGVRRKHFSAKDSSFCKEHAGRQALVRNRLEGESSSTRNCEATGGAAAAVPGKEGSSAAPPPSEECDGESGQTTGRVLVAWPVLRSFATPRLSPNPGRTGQARAGTTQPALACFSQVAQQQG